MSILSTDNAFIFSLLETSGNMLNDFSTDKAVLFDLEDDCYVVLYSASTRNFSCFKAENYLQHTDALPSLLEAVQTYTAPGFSESLASSAIKLIEDKLHSKNNSRFFFDAH